MGLGSARLLMVCEDLVVRCRDPECGRISCRRCREAEHAPLSCEEVEKDAETKIRWLGLAV